MVKEVKVEKYFSEYTGLEMYITNTLTNAKEKFIPIDNNNVRMYVCGPTVYDRPHIGNARSSVVFDVFYRVLRSIYHKVTYVRNITDVDDKIINMSNESGESIKDLTTRITAHFHNDLQALNCLIPDYEPKATENIPQMIAMIERLILRRHAYINKGHVYFDVGSFNDYGKLSNKRLEELEIGARIEVLELKKNPLDFVLWKPKKVHESMYFDSPWGQGRPGWHIECSAMSKELLGNKFDIHGGGTDLVFPHHENEIAQSICESSNNQFAKYWIHNGFLTVNGNKMSKSLNNFVTVKELLSQGISGLVIRYFYLTAHYRKPLDFNQKALDDAYKSISKFKMSLNLFDKDISKRSKEVSEEFLSYLLDDLNTPAALSHIHNLSNKILNGDKDKINDLYNCCQLLGVNIQQHNKSVSDDVIALVEERKIAKKQGQWHEADKLRIQIANRGYQVIDTKDGYKLIPNN